MRRKTEVEREIELQMRFIIRISIKIPITDKLKTLTKKLL